MTQIFKSREDMIPDVPVIIENDDMELVEKLLTDSLYNLSLAMQALSESTEAYLDACFEEEAESTPEAKAGVIIERQELVLKGAKTQFELSLLAKSLGINGNTAYQRLFDKPVSMEGI